LRKTASAHGFSVGLAGPYQDQNRFSSMSALRQPRKGRQTRPCVLRPRGPRWTAEFEDPRQDGAAAFCRPRTRGAKRRAL